MPIRGTHALNERTRAKRHEPAETRPFNDDAHLNDARVGFRRTAGYFLPRTFGRAGIDLRPPGFVRAVGFLLPPGFRRAAGSFSARFFGRAAGASLPRAFDEAAGGSFDAAAGESLSKKIVAGSSFDRAGG